MRRYLAMLVALVALVSALTFSAVTNPAPAVAHVNGCSVGAGTYYPYIFIKKWISGVGWIGPDTYDIWAYKWSNVSTQATHIHYCWKLRP